MIRRSTLIAVEIALGLIAALAIGLGVTWWRLSQGPLELSFIKPQIEAEFSAARAGRPVGLERVELAWAPRGTLELRAVGVTIQDQNGAVLSRSEEARIELALLPMLIGRFQVVSAEFEGGVVTLSRKADESISVAFGPEGAPADIVIPPPPPDETLRERVARVLDGMEAAFQPIGAGGSLRSISLRNANLAVIDEPGGGRWTADGANLALARRSRELALTADARLEGAYGQAPARLRVTTDTRFQNAVIEFGAENARPRALFSPAALGPFAGLDAPLTTSISIGLDREVGVTRFEGEAVLGAGQADMGGERVNLDGGRVRGRYDIESDELIIDEIGLAGDRTRIRGEVRLRSASAILRAAPNEPANLDIALPSMTIEVPGTFTEPVSFSNVQVQGVVIGAERAIQFSRIQAQTGDAQLEGAGRLYFARANSEGGLFPGIELQASVSGPLQARSAIALWPIGVGEAAREYVARSLEAGVLTELRAQLDIRPIDFATGVFRNEAMDVRFNVDGGVFRFVSTMSPVTDTRGSAVLRGNRFDLAVTSARINNVQLTNARLELPRLKPRGALATISARAEGDARHLLELLMQEPIDMGERLPVDVASVSGRGSFDIRIQRPMLAEAPREDWRFNVSGSLRDFGGAMRGRNVAISRGMLNVRGDHRAVTVSGPIRAGTSALEQVRWVERLNSRGRVSSEYQISGDFDANDLQRLGYPVARYAQGRIGVTVTGQGRGFDIDNAAIDLDLTRAAIEAPYAFWTKSAGMPASLRFNVERQLDGGLAFIGIDGRGGGLTAQGRLRLARDESVAEADISRLVVEGHADARITAARGADGGLDVAVRGSLFDAAPFMSAQTAPEGGGEAGGPPAPFRASVVVDRLKMRGGATLSEARADVVVLRGALSSLAINGRSPGNREFTLALGPRPGEPQGRIRFRAEDAGFAVEALTGADNVVGGVATAEGHWRPGPPSTAQFNVRMEGFQVVRLPAMARLLSSAGSLTGLVEMLNGDGIGFSALEAQMSYANDRITFTEGAMRGPSLGLTASGAYNIDRDDLDVDGVVAPSPALNLSILGEIPVIGNLIVSRRGEGVFGMTYSINGPAAAPRVGVNPMSALTPGILRRIFEPMPERQNSSPAPTPSGGPHSFEGASEADVAGAESPAPTLAN